MSWLGQAVAKVKAKVAAMPETHKIEQAAAKVTAAVINTGVKVVTFGTVQQNVVSAWDIKQLSIDVKKATGLTKPPVASAPIQASIAPASVQKPAVVSQPSQPQMDAPKGGISMPVKVLGVLTVLGLGWYFLSGKKKG